MLCWFHRRVNKSFRGRAPIAIHCRSVHVYCSKNWLGSCFNLCSVVNWSVFCRTIYSLGCVIFCSDGSGRTGTYCLIDLVLNRIVNSKLTCSCCHYVQTLNLSKLLNYCIFCCVFLLLLVILSCASCTQFDTCRICKQNVNWVNSAWPSFWG